MQASSGSTFDVLSNRIVPITQMFYKRKTVYDILSLCFSLILETVSRRQTMKWLRAKATEVINGLMLVRCSVGYWLLIYYRASIMARKFPRCDTNLHSFDRLTYSIWERDACELTSIWVLWENFTTLEWIRSEAEDVAKSLTKKLWMSEWIFISAPSDYEQQCSIRWHLM